MHRWTAFLFAGLLAIAVAVVVSKGGRRAAGPKEPGPVDAGAEAAPTSAADAAAVEAETDAEAPPEPSGAGTTGVDAGGTLLLSGEPPPALPADAPKSVVFGVILVQYQGAQGAPPGVRSRDAALELAKQLAVEAKTDFKAALAKGDKGSTDNVGRLPRGILEPAPEYVLFSLQKGGTSEPVDTPRGFWIVQRIE